MVHTLVSNSTNLCKHYTKIVSLSFSFQQDPSFLFTVWWSINSHDHDEPSSYNSSSMEIRYMDSSPPLNKSFQCSHIRLSPNGLKFTRTLGKIWMRKSSCSRHSFVSFDSLLSKGENKKQTKKKACEHQTCPIMSTKCPRSKVSLFP